MPLRSKKKRIAVALREQVWVRSVGETFSSKCTVSWCNNPITVFTFQCGHVQAESKGGPTTLENLRPICSRCNQSMGTMHMNDWEQLGGRAPAPAPPTPNGCLGWVRRLFRR
jgi:hypothetical protein